MTLNLQTVKLLVRYCADPHRHHCSWLWRVHIHWSRGDAHWCQLDPWSCYLYAPGCCYANKLPRIPHHPSSQLTSVLRLWDLSTELFAWPVLLATPFLRSWGFSEGMIVPSYQWYSFPPYLSVFFIPLELRFWLQGDNCPKEVRNSFTGKFGCLLAQANYFVGVSHHHMVVGHTHEDIGWGPCYLFWSQDVVVVFILRFKTHVRVHVICQGLLFTCQESLFYTTTYLPGCVVFIGQCLLFASSCSTTKPMFKIKPWPDGIFSLITSCLNAESCIETPRDIQRTNKKYWQTFMKPYLGSFLWLLFSQCHWWPDFY